MFVKIVALYAGINILLLLGLGLAVAMTRQRRRVVLGDGGDEIMQRMIRAHGNAAEYIPAGLAGLILLSIMAPATPAWLLHAAGLSLTAGRILHAAGLIMGPLNAGRVIGILLTLASYALIGGGLIALSMTERF
jgi:hypothetical protein